MISREHNATMTVPLDQTTATERRTIEEADARRLGADHGTELWRLRTLTSNSTVVAEALFTVPSGNERWQVVADRVFALLATADLQPEQGWREITSGHFHGPVRSSP